ncbi:hypothetical protein L202_05332 [Cryptococcus amylolentus CBS 6039]|uniref:Uncharacterized protein n=2 Tax=Cryptococcus amylolentus TaxID=104669 RepID=A0A1E3HK29_9TREE|nr:hypothetical protein L202_05332 [Cryptococcus amylolentus CBS 6039]ODN76698.1 hypothetical protein L202_05332 [Cryptococcus amylolentus CBS 6039]ODO04654.1 hypothetical protein I350_05263 [Cryptococcus amylolentus CBS 6273]
MVRVLYWLPQTSESLPAQSSSTKRLSALLTSISSLLASHVNSSLAAPAYIASIRYFQHRVLTMLQEAQQEGMPPCGAKVEELEREWWNSEVVAAWYGPKMPQGVPQTHKKGPKGKDMTRKIALTQSDQNREDKRLREKRRCEPLGAIVPIRCDASFVGLNDE